MKTNQSLSLLCKCLQDTTSGSPNALKIAQNINTDWSAVARIADGHFVTPLLYHRLVQKDLLSLLPEDLQIMLGEIYKLNRLRNDLIYDEINRIAAHLNPAGIEPIFIKGSATLLMDVYEDPGLRVMNDVDFLVSKKNLSTCIELMQSIGFHTMEGVNLPPDYYHQNPLVHKRHSIRFEIHEKLDQNPILESEMIIAESMVIQMPDGVVRVPSNNHFTIHNILHHQVFDEGLKKERISLYQLYDLYIIRENYNRSLGWKSIGDFFTTHSLEMAYYNSIGMLRKYFEQAPPPEIRFLTTKMFMVWFKRIYWNIKSIWNRYYKSHTMHRCYLLFASCRSFLRGRD